MDNQFITTSSVFLTGIFRVFYDWYTNHLNKKRDKPYLSERTHETTYKDGNSSKTIKKHKK